MGREREKRMKRKMGRRRKKKKFAVVVLLPCRQVVMKARARGLSSAPGMLDSLSLFFCFSSPGSLPSFLFFFFQPNKTGFDLVGILKKIFSRIVPDQTCSAKIFDFEPNRTNMSEFWTKPFRVLIRFGFANKPYYFGKFVRNETNFRTLVWPNNATVDCTKNKSNCPVNKGILSSHKCTVTQGWDLREPTLTRGTTLQFASLGMCSKNTNYEKANVNTMISSDGQIKLNL